MQQNGRQKSHAWAPLNGFVSLAFSIETAEKGRYVPVRLVLVRYVPVRYISAFLHPRYVSSLKCGDRIQGYSGRPKYSARLSKVGHILGGII